MSLKDRDDKRRFESSRERGRDVFNIAPTFFKFFGRLPMLVQRSVKISLPFVVLAIFTFVPMPVDIQIQHMLGIFLCIAMLWTFGALPLPVTALLVPVLLTFYGIFPTDKALTPFANPVVYLLMGGLIIAEAFRKHGIDRRLAYVLVSRFGGDIGKTLFSLMLVAAILSMWISNTATTALLIPVVLGIASMAGQEKKRVAALMLLGVGMGSAIGGMATITGSAPNAIVSGLLAERTSWTFLDWMKVGVPTSITLLVIAWFVLLKTSPIRAKYLDIGAVKDGLKSMGPLSYGEKKTLGIFFPTVILWMAGADIGALFGFPPSFMSATIVALSASFLLFLTKTLDWEDTRSISWDIFLVIGAGLALGEGMQFSGTAVWIANILIGLTGGLHIIVIMLAIITLTVALSNFMSNTATVAILAPILLGMSDALGIDPKFLVLACGLSVALSFSTPIGTPPFTLIFSTGMVSKGEIARCGLKVTLPAMIAILMIIYLLVSFDVV